MVSYLLALGLTFFFPLLSERFSVCLSFVYLETMFGSHRSWLARYIGPLLVFLSEMGSCLSWSISLFFPKQLHAALILAYISSLVVSLRCVVCPRYLNLSLFQFNNNDDCTERRNSRFFLQSPHCLVNCLQHICTSGQGAIMCKSRAIRQVLNMCNMSCVTWYEETAQLLSLTEFKSHLFLLYFIGLNHYLMKDFHK